MLIPVRMGIVGIYLLNLKGHWDKLNLPVLILLQNARYISSQEK